MERIPLPDGLGAVLPDVTGTDLPTLLLDESSHVPRLDEARRIFVNRNLRLDKVEVIGFDMDYTLAIYKKRMIEELAYRCTVDKLIARGYPAAIREVAYEPDRVIRGLVVEKSTGNMFKMDRFGHVGRVFHGTRELSKEERIQLYRTKKIDLWSGDYEWIDTLFSLPEACLYARLVDWFDAAGLAEAPSYAQLAVDVRTAIDEAHADGSIKDVVMPDPGAYIERSEELAHALHRLRSSGKRLFVLTNSYWPYTRAVMRYLLDGVLSGYPSWRHYFDLVIVGARKPKFFGRGEPFLQVDPQTDRVSESAATSLDKGGIYQGGSLADLERLGGFGGERVLYVGDHIYGDILRSKKASLWRTCMIIPEMEDVIWHEELFAPDLARLAAIDDEVKRTDYGVNYYKLLLNRIERVRTEKTHLEPEARAALEQAERLARSALEQLRLQVRRQLARFYETEDDIDRGFNPWWGRLFVEGAETSRFGQQIEDFACLYTSRVSNFANYSPVQYFRSLAEAMPHERRR